MKYVCVQLNQFETLMSQYFSLSNEHFFLCSHEYLFQQACC